MAVKVDFSQIRAFDQNGKTVPYALARFYTIGTSTPRTVYTNSSLVTAHPTPLVANASGIFPAVWSSVAVKVNVTTPTGTSLPGYPQDPSDTFGADWDATIDAAADAAAIAAAAAATAAAEAAAAQALLATQFTPNQFLTTAAVQTYSTGTAGALNVTATNHVLFGASPAGPQTYGVDYTVSGGAITFLFPVLGNELYTVLSMPRFTNSEAQVILQDYVDALTATTLTTIQGFGLGVTGTQVLCADIDAELATGDTRTANTTIGVFPHTNSPGFLNVSRTSGGWMRQTLTYRGDTPIYAGRTYTRVTTDDIPVTWGAWRRIRGSDVGTAFGYDSGEGGAVTQITSRTTGITLDKPSGRVTMFSAAGSATWSSFTLTNSTIAAGDTIVLTQQGGTNTYLLSAKAQAGSVVISFATTGGTATDAPIINFAVIKTSGT